MSKLIGTNNNGLLIRSQIIKPFPTFTLRTLGLSVQIKGRLFGNSMLWLFSRVSSDDMGVGGLEPTANRPVCILKKIPDSQRLFCIFGLMVEKSK